MEKNRISHVLLLYCTAIWDANFIATKYPLVEAIPVNFTLLRFILGSVLLFLLLLFMEDVKAPLKDFYRLSVLGVAGISIYRFLFTHTLKCTAEPIRQSSSIPFRSAAAFVSKGDLWRREERNRAGSASLYGFIPFCLDMKGSNSPFPIGWLSILFSIIIVPAQRGIKMRVSRTIISIRCAGLSLSAAPIYVTGITLSNAANSQCRGLRQCLSDKRALFLSFL